MDDNPIKRLYYSIAEVSKITGLKQYVLRFWETEFPELRPGKNKAGNRIYRKSDIRLIFLIKRLLYREKYTIEGARQRLKVMRKNRDATLQLPLEELKKDDLIEEIRVELKLMLELLDSKQIGA